MLYRTQHHTFPSTFNPFSHSSLTPHLPPSPFPSPSTQGMEYCVQEALKSGVGVESADEFWGDDFFVDQLLDFSNGFTEAAEGPPEEMEHDKKNARYVSQEKFESSAVSSEDDFGPLPGVPAEGLESLEWLSHFVEDSFSDYPLAGKLPHYPAASLSKPEVAVQEQRCFTTPVQTKARTKRGRTGVRVWPALSPSLTESSTSSNSSTYSTNSFPPRNPWEVIVEPFLGDSLVNKHKRKPATVISNGGAAGATQPRRCSHCDVTKTPQWRAGPMGSKTLCNACGVRFKSGRLLPEYRPACSPTFSLEMHSNNHRKVLEMRRKKESEMEGGGVASPVRSF